MIASIFVFSVLTFVKGTEVKGPFTVDFQNWLQSAGYADYNFPSLHLGNAASFGGRTSSDQKIEKEPVIFIHGNSDGALDEGTLYNSGWTASIEHFMINGYTSAELYALTWGDRDLSQSYSRVHSCVTLKRVRRFIDAVLAYTNTTKVDIIAHSMGVTVARMAIAGGDWWDQIESCYLGTPINGRIQSFLGIAGANYGMCACIGEAANAFKACGKSIGFYAGDSCQKVPKSPLSKSKSNFTCSDTPENADCKVEYASNLMNLNDKHPKPAERVYSFWSDEDEIIGNNNVWGRRTSEIPGSDEHMIFPTLKHHELKINTAKSQHDFVNRV
ncbi:hypothetical protein FO519_008708 [Halicephalobus sp. NKZ332]|nr:hypothetical protein FO519_008708 [Halicephalobus sp. NKZ332]